MRFRSIVEHLFDLHFIESYPARTEHRGDLREQLPRAIVRAGGDELSIRRDLRSHHAALMPGERLQEGEVRPMPELARLVEAGREQVRAVDGIPSHVRDEVRVGADRVEGVLRAEIPHADWGGRRRHEQEQQKE